MTERSEFEIHGNGGAVAVPKLETSEWGRILQFEGCHSRAWQGGRSDIRRLNIKDHGKCIVQSARGKLRGSPKESIIFNSFLSAAGILYRDFAQSSDFPKYNNEDSRVIHHDLRIVFSFSTKLFV